MSLILEWVKHRVMSLHNFVHNILNRYLDIYDLCHWYLLLQPFDGIIQGVKLITCQPKREWSLHLFKKELHFVSRSHISYWTMTKLPHYHYIDYNYLVLNILEFSESSILKYLPDLVSYCTMTELFIIIIRYITFWYASWVLIQRISNSPGQHFEVLSNRSQIYHTAW